MGLPALGGETLPNAARWHHIFPISWTSGSTRLQRAEGWESILHTRMTKGNTRSPFSPVNCTQMFCTVGLGPLAAHQAVVVVIFLLPPPPAFVTGGPPHCPWLSRQGPAARPSPPRPPIWSGSCCRRFSCGWPLAGGGCWCSTTWGGAAPPCAHCCPMVYLCHTICTYLAICYLTHIFHFSPAQLHS